jgi:hypothetical protein
VKKKERKGDIELKRERQREVETESDRDREADRRGMKRMAVCS